MKKQITKLVATGLILGSVCQAQTSTYFELFEFDPFAMLCEFDELFEHTQDLCQLNLEHQAPIEVGYNENRTAYTINVSVPVNTEDIKVELVTDDQDDTLVNLLKVSFKQEQPKGMWRTQYRSTSIINGQVVSDEQYTTKQNDTEQTLTVVLPNNINKAIEPTVVLSRCGTMHVSIPLAEQAAPCSVKVLPMMIEEATQEPLIEEVAEQTPVESEATKTPRIEEPEDTKLEKEIDATDALK